MFMVAYTRDLLTKVHAYTYKIQLILIESCQSDETPLLYSCRIQHPTGFLNAEQLCVCTHTKNDDMETHVNITKTYRSNTDRNISSHNLVEVLT